MNEASYDAATALVPKTYVSQCRDARRTHEKHIQMLIQQVQYNNLWGLIITAIWDAYDHE